MKKIKYEPKDLEKLVKELDSSCGALGPLKRVKINLKKLKKSLEAKTLKKSQSTIQNYMSNFDKTV
jgi:hypothetical protein